MNQIVGVCTGNDAAQQPGRRARAAARPTVRKVWRLASSTSGKIPSNTFCIEVRSDHTGAFGRPFFSALRRDAPSRCGLPALSLAMLDRSSSASTARCARSPDSRRRRARFPAPHCRRRADAGGTAARRRADARQPHRRGVRAGALRRAGAGGARPGRAHAASRRPRAKRKSTSRGRRRGLPNWTIARRC